MISENRYNKVFIYPQFMISISPKSVLFERYEWSISVISYLTIDITAGQSLFSNLGTSINKFNEKILFKTTENGYIYFSVWELIHQCMEKYIYWESLKTGNEMSFMKHVLKCINGKHRREYLWCIRVYMNIFLNNFIWCKRIILNFDGAITKSFKRGFRKDLNSI
jgi:hypothetical protein